MKTLLIIAVVGALGFGGYKLYEKRQASKLRSAFTYLICDTGFMAQADESIRGTSGLNRGTSINDAMAMMQKSMQQAASLAAWTRSNLPAERVGAIASAGSLEKNAMGQAMQDGYDAAKLRCPEKVEGLNPGAIGITVGLLVVALKGT